MVWQFYGIIAVSTMWIIHAISEMTIKRMNLLKMVYNQSGVPLYFENGYLTNNNKIQFKYSNTVEKCIEGFEVIVEIKNIENGKLELVDYYIDIESRPLMPYLSRFIAFEITSLDLEKHQIGRVYPRTVLFDDNSTWMLK